MDAALETLRARRGGWAETGARARAELLRQLRRSVYEAAEEWVEVSCEAKGLAAADPRSGEEWINGPHLVLRYLRYLQAAVAEIAARGRPRIPGPVRRLPNGQVAARVLPYDRWDRILYSGWTAEVWMERGVAPETLAETQALAYHEQPPRRRLTLVLGAGNVSAIGPLDALHELFVQGSVVLLKMNPVNEYLGPALERALRPLVELGFLRIAYGGTEEGAYLCQHPAVEAIHITGSDKTYQAIVFGSGEEGARRKAAGTPLLAKPVTAELGNVSPVVVVPGPWSDADLAFQAEHIVTMLANNAGFNCNTMRVLVTHAEWPLRRTLLEKIRQVFRRLPPRSAYYPGAAERFEAFLRAHPRGERLGEPGEGELPWGMLTGLTPGDRGSLCYTSEAFTSLFCETAISSPDPARFLDQAVAFCNEELWGTLNATVLVHPRSRDDAELGPALERAVEALRYGTVSINVWAAAGFALGVTPWGAYPGHTPQDIQSGVGFVHNALMFSRIEKTVLAAPFRIRPKPPWLATHPAARQLGASLTAFEAAPALWRVPVMLGRGVLRR
jgi:hypothetical protein